MKAQSLSVCIPNIGCNKNCPYCVSNMTGHMKSDLNLMLDNIDLVIEFAKMAQVSNVIFTGKGEPLLNPEIKVFTSKFAKEKFFPLELQTNGLLINKMIDVLEEFNVIAISVDNLDDLEHINFMKLNEKKKLIRLAICVNDSIKRSPKEIIKCVKKKYHVNQISFRYLTIPKGKENYLEAKWIKENTKNSIEFFEQLNIFLTNEGFFLRQLPYGAKLYDVDGVGVTWFDYCIQENSNENDIRSLIFMEDGHLYTHWGKKGSIIF